MAALDFNTIVGHNTQTFDMVCELFEQYDKNQILYALYNKELDLEEIQMMLADVKATREKMHKEYISISRFSTKFPWEFATANNKCFDTVRALLNKIRSTSKASRELYNKFRPKLNRKAHAPNGEEIRKKTNYLLKGTPYEKDLFSEEYPPIVEELCSELELLYTDIIAINVICKETLAMERSIKMDKDKCLDVYYKSVEQIKKSLDWDNGSLVIELKSASVDEITKIREHAKSLKEFAYEEYHNINGKEFKQYIIKITLIRGIDNGLQGLESVLWTKNPEKGKQVRYVIEHLEDIVDGLEVFKTSGTHKMPGGFITWLMEWSEKEGTDTDFFKYLRDTYKGTKYPLPTQNSAFSNSKSENTRNPTNNKVRNIKREDFLNKINSYFSQKPEESQQTAM